MYSLELPPGYKVPADQRRKILASLDTDEERLERDANTLRAWVNMQPHLPHLPEQELYFVKAYLLHSKNSMEKAKKGLDLYLTSRSAHYDFFGSYDLDAKTMTEYAKFMTIGMSKELTKDFRRVLLVSMTPEDRTEEDFNMECRINLIKADLVMRMDVNLGIELVIDMSHFGPNHAKVIALQLNTLKKFINCTLGAVPVRLKHIHFVNPPSVFLAVFPLIQPLMKEKLRKRLLMHSSLKSLYSYLSPRFLAREMGGDLPSCAEMEASLAPLFSSLTDFFESQRGMRTDESRRPGGPSSLFGEATFGCEGSFRKLALD